MDDSSYRGDSSALPAAEPEHEDQCMQDTISHQRVGAVDAQTKTQPRQEFNFARDNDANYEEVLADKVLSSSAAATTLRRPPMQSHRQKWGLELCHRDRELVQ